MAKVLMIDDSAAMRQLAALTLKSRGYQVVEAIDGQQGLEKAQSDTYDLIITDRNMPIKNGIELIQELRQLTTYKFTPILMLTTEGGEAQRTEGRQAGVTGWIMKPFNPDTLLKTVEKVLA